MEIEANKTKNEIVIYQPDEITKIEVKIDNETVWLNRQQLATLFGRDVKTIGKHINNALREELYNMAVVANYATTATDGKTYKVNVKPNTEQGTTLRLKGWGLRKNNGSRGDFDVIVKHKFPSTLSEEEIEKINELKELKNFK